MVQQHTRAPVVTDVFFVLFLFPFGANTRFVFFFSFFSFFPFFFFPFFSLDSIP